MVEVVDVVDVVEVFVGTKPKTVADLCLTTEPPPSPCSTAGFSLLSLVRLIPRPRSNTSDINLLYEHHLPIVELV